MNFVQYWPKSKEKEVFGDVSVQIKKVENLPDYIIRHMAVSKVYMYDIVDFIACEKISSLYWNKTSQNMSK